MTTEDWLRLIENEPKLKDQKWLTFGRNRAIRNEHYACPVCALCNACSYTRMWVTDYSGAVAGVFGENELLANSVQMIVNAADYETTGHQDIRARLIKYLMP